ncbi:MAG: OB-fold domain-containing protein [Deltaproteobacteria bacterium]|nr:OB-fold domain-containing protein [Deltaproteobacteria bacterium]
MNTNRKMMPVREGLWSEPSAPGEEPQLIGSHCLTCGELFFPRQDSGLCSYCQSKDLEEVKLSSKGTIFSYTVVMLRPPVYYKAEVPYAIGFVELPEGVRVETLFTDYDIESLHVGMEVEMVIEKLHEDEEGNEIMSYRFRPVKSEIGGKTT